MFRTCYFPGLKRLNFLAQPEICEFEVAILADQDIIRFDIAMYVVHFMHVLNGYNQLADVEPGLCLSEDVFFYEETEQVTSWHPLHCNIQVILILEGRFQLNQPSASVP